MKLIRNILEEIGIAIKRIWRVRVPVGLSLVAIAAAVAPGVVDLSFSLDGYSAELAVLTITAIAIIWYTFFTYGSIDHLRRTQESAAEGDRRRLFYIADQLRKFVQDLPDRIDHPSLQHATPWQQIFEIELLLLASSVNIGLVADQASKAATATAWLRTKLAKVQVEDGQVSQAAYSAIPARDWSEARTTALRNLEQVTFEVTIPQNFLRGIRESAKGS